MSNHLAIATVTATLRTLVQNAVNADLSGATVSHVRPTAGADGLTAFGVNIYLYQAVPNTAWRNSDLPTRGAVGSVAQRPTIALDLHYLLTFHGNDSTLETQRLMGSTVRAIHARPSLSGELVQAMLEAAELDDPGHVLVGSDLARAVERVRFTPLPFTLEELSKLWSVMLQTPYALSMGYLASVVLLEADETPRRTLPVRERSIRVIPFQRARVDSVEALAGATAPVEMGDTVVLRGRQLAGAVERIRVGVAGDLIPVPGSVSPEVMQVELTGAALRAGVVGVQVIYEGGSTSNVAPLILRPRISRDAADNYELDVQDLTTDPADGTHAATLQVVLLPEVEPEQSVELFLNSFRPSAGGGAAYRFDAEARAAASDTLRFPIRGVAAGSYLVRVQVDGAETVLELEDDEADPDFGYYVRPSLTLP